MKTSIPLLLIALSVCVPAIHAASISRKTLVVAEPLGFLTKFILNKRAKAVNAERNDDVQTLGATKRESVILETPIVAAASIQIEVKAEPGNGEVSETKGTKNQIQSASVKPAVDSTSPRSTTTTDASTWSWWQLNHPKKSVKTNTRDVIKLSFRGNANTARRATETASIEAAPVEVVETPANVTPVEAVPVEVVETIAQDTVVASAGASASGNDGSPVSMASTPQAVEKKGTIHIVASPKHRILYEDNTPEYHVTLQVIKVELDPAHILPIPDTVAVDVKPAEITSGVDVSDTTISAAGEASAVGTVATATSDISVDGGIPTGGVTSGNVQVNLNSGSYVLQSGLAGAGATGVTEATGVTGEAGGAGGAGVAGGVGTAGVAGGAGTAGVAGGAGITGGAGIAGVTGVTGTTGVAGVSAKNKKGGGTGFGSDSSEEDE